MSWHYSQELEGGFSVDAYLAGLRWRPARSIPTVGASCSSDKEMERSTPSLSGMTCEPWTAQSGAGALTSSPPGGLAKGSAQQAGNEGLTTSDPAYGLRWPALSMRFDRASYSWKTARALFPLEGLPAASPTLPRSGTMRRGILSERSTLARRTGVIDVGFSLTWPTPCATEVRQGYQDRSRGKKGSQKSLTTEVIDRAGGPAVGGGKLNPTWVEWLMGWPIGWTDCEPLEMDRFHRWPRSPFKPCGPDSTAGGEE